MPITLKELTNTINSLPNNKTPGPDGLTYEFYKKFININGPLIISFFNKILNTANIPDSWRESVTILILKKSNEKHLIQNWRSISLTNTDYKIFTKILANRLNNNIIQKIIESHQNSFVKNRSIINNLLNIEALLSHYDRKLNNGILLFLD